VHGSREEGCVFNARSFVLAAGLLHGCATISERRRGDPRSPAKINAIAHPVRQRDKSADDAAGTETVSLTAYQRAYGGNLSWFIGDLPLSRDSARFRAICLTDRTCLYYL